VPAPITATITLNQCLPDTSIPRIARTSWLREPTRGIDRRLGFSPTASINVATKTNSTAARTPKTHSHPNVWPARLHHRNDEQELARRAGPDGAKDTAAARHLAKLLAQRNDDSALRERAAAGDRYSRRQLPVVLARLGKTAELAELAVDTGDVGVQGLLAELLGSRNNLGELTRRASGQSAGNGSFRTEDSTVACNPDRDSRDLR